MNRQNCCNGCCNNFPCCCPKNQCCFGNICIVCPTARQGVIGSRGPTGPQGIQGEIGPVVIVQIQ